jgi:hypothetical protein
MKTPDIPRWPLYFIKWTVGITATGALLGAIVFPLVGLVFDTGRTTSELAWNGIKILGFFFGIWAPGTALVLTVRKVYEAKKAGTLVEEESPSDEPSA